MAAGKVITGYSHPYVAKYSAAGTTITYSERQELARGVNVTVTPSNSGVVKWYANNVLSEIGASIFTGGTVAFECDQPKTAAAKVIEGTPETSKITVDGNSVEVTEYDDRQTKNYVGAGFIVRAQEDGAVTYTPVVLTKILFSDTALSAATQAEGLSFQDTTLNADIFSDDSEHHAWKRVAADQETEAAALKILIAMLGGA